MREPNFTGMSLVSLKDDLLQEFREEKVMITEQIELLDPLVAALNKPAARHMLGSGTLIIAEIACYIVTAGGLAFTLLMHTIYPFSILREVFYNPELRYKVGAMDLTYLTLAVYALSALAVIFAFVLGRTAREIRLKNEILYQAGKDVKVMIGQHLERKAIIDTIEQRHMLGAPVISYPAKEKKEQERKKESVATIGNPAFG